MDESSSRGGGLEVWGAWGCLISMVRILEGNMTKWGTSWGG